MSDARRVLPLAVLDPAPWNPKTPISGRYRQGLESSLDHFGVRDDLKVWERPDAPGRFYVLDGNQRLDLLKERQLQEVECRILAELDEENARLFTAAYDRNHAAYDEAKLAALADGLKATSADLVARMLRPDRPLVTPPPERESFRPDAPPELAAVIPLIFSVTREGYDQIRATILKARSRLVREKRLKDVLEALSEREADDVVVELALRIAAR